MQAIKKATITRLSSGGADQFQRVLLYYEEGNAYTTENHFLLRNWWSAFSVLTWTTADFLSAQLAVFSLDERKELILIICIKLRITAAGSAAAVSKPFPAGICPALNQIKHIQFSRCSLPKFSRFKLSLCPVPAPPSLGFAVSWLKQLKRLERLGRKIHDLATSPTTPAERHHDISSELLWIFKNVQVSHQTCPRAHSWPAEGWDT